MSDISIFQALGKKRLEKLDGLRGFCSLSVLITHLISVPYWTTQNNEFYPSLFLKSISLFGHITVLIFFVLSGFVIGYTTPQQFTWEKAHHYIIRRLIRLYPIYLFAIILTFALADTPYNILDIIGHLLFMQGWLVPVINNNLPLWSIHYEFIFYLLFLAIWKFNLKIRSAIFVCVLSGIFSAIFKIHLFEIAGYFTLWLSGFWLANNMLNFKLLSKDVVSYRFWSSCIVMAAFANQNILMMAINKYGTSSSVLPDIFLVVLLTSVVAALVVEQKIPWYNFSFSLVFLMVIVTIIYAFKQNTFYSFAGLQFGYQSAAFWILFLPMTLILKNLTVNILDKMKNVGYFSYALYVIHYPLIISIYHLVPLDNVNAIFFICAANIVAAVCSLSLAWFLECYIHVKIAKQLKHQLQLL